MKFEYNLVASVASEEFEEAHVSNEAMELYNVADGDEVRKMERLLDAAEGSLEAGGPYCLNAGKCTCCGKDLTMYDFVFTGLIDANHPKSFIYQILAGDKRVIQSPRRVRCSSCGTVTSQTAHYYCKAYACDDDGNK
jgi:hypothetical protein